MQDETGSHDVESPPAERDERDVRLRELREVASGVADVRRLGAERLSVDEATRENIVPRLALTGFLCAVSLLGAAAVAMGNEGMTVVGKVTALPVADVLLRPANFFDLEGKTLSFTPDDAGGYDVRIGPLTWVGTSAATGRSFDLCELPVEPQRGFHHHASRPDSVAAFSEAYTPIDLPFEFPFAGRRWTRVYANTNGNVSFAVPEARHWEERDPWSSGTMRSVAAAVDSRSAAGLEAMIAVLWAVYGETDVSVDSSSERVAITWNAVRKIPRNHHYQPRGPNVFQARLFPSGAIEFAYREVSERDGIVGLFHGAEARGRTLNAVEDPVGDTGNATVDIVSVEFVDKGSTVVVSATMAADIPARVSSGSVEYRVFLDFDGTSCAVGLEVNATGRGELSWCGAAPSVVGYRVQGATLEIPISKTLLNDARTVSWLSMDAVWWGRDVFDDLDGGRRIIRSERGHDLSSMLRTVAGNVFEVFHYPSTTNDGGRVMSSIYGRVLPADELAVVFTDFRFDDLFNTGPGTGPIDVPIQGIGDDQADPSPGSRYGSDNLLSALSGARFVGGPRWAESGVEDDYEFHGHSYGVRHVAHELVHRWAAHLRFRDPASGRVEDLTDDWCRCHWSEWLHVPARHPVWNGFANEPYSTGSIMGGGVWRDNGDGTFTEQDTGYPRAMGLSDLDLYAMGMIPPEEVRPTFLLRDAAETGARGTVRATKVPVRIEDIVAAMGPRVPSASEQRKRFRLGVYLLHEGSSPRADLLARTRSLTESVVKYFSLATADRSGAGLEWLANVRDQRWAAGAVIEPLVLPSAWGGQGKVTYSLSPKPPPGVAFDDSSRTLSGRPTTVSRATEYTYTATDAAGASVSLSFTIEVVEPGKGCVSSSSAVCLQGSRYEVTVDWWTADGESGSGQVASVGTADSGLFWFFGPTNWELLVKVLDACGVNGHHWVFGAATTDLGYRVRVVDTESERVREYLNEPGQAAQAIADVTAFPEACAATGASAASRARNARDAPGSSGLAGPFGLSAAPGSSAFSGASQTGDPSLVLQKGRFDVRVQWTTEDGETGPGSAAPERTVDSGLFWFFEPSNWEMLVKVLDGCALNDHYWVLAGSATTLGFEIVVTDTQTDAERRYAKTDVRERAAALVDSSAFPCRSSR